MYARNARTTVVTGFSILPEQKHYLDALPNNTKSAFIREAIELLKQKRYLESIRNA